MVRLHPLQPFFRPVPKPDPVIAHVRHLAAEFGCRLEISSDERLPVAASNQDRTRYGFGSSVSDAVNQLTHHPRISLTAKQQAAAAKG